MSDNQLIIMVVVVLGIWALSTVVVLIVDREPKQTGGDNEASENRTEQATEPLPDLRE